MTMARPGVLPIGAPVIDINTLKVRTIRQDGNGARGAVAHPR